MDSANDPLVDQVQACAAKADLAYKAADKAREAAEETREMVRTIKGSVLRVIDDQLEMQAGIPSGKGRRIALLAAAILTSALVSAVVSGCVLYAKG